MQIQRISQNLTTFKSNRACTKNERGEVTNRNTTFFFRNDLDWFNLARFIDKKFEDEHHVTIHNFACSDGSETYSLIMALSKEAKKPKKFFPILAKDMDSEIIQKAEAGEANLMDMDFITFNQKNVKITDWFNCDKSADLLQHTYVDTFGNTQYNYSMKYHVRNPLIKNCRFECKDIKRDVLNIDKNKKCVVLFRNAWPYLMENERIELARNLKANMQKGSLLIIGDYDLLFERNATFPPLLLLMNGFKIVKNEDLSKGALIYERI